MAASGKSERYVQKWFALCRHVDQPTVMDKLSEALWRFAFYTVATLYGLAVLWDKSWFADTLYCWVRARRGAASVILHAVGIPVSGVFA